MSGLVRPGFCLDTTFRGHLSTVRFVRYNKKGQFYVSCDDKSLKAWTPTRDGGCRVLHDVVYPSYQSTFITSMVIAHEPLNLLFCACLDGNLRLYSDKLRLRSCMPWSNGAVRDMVYNFKRNEVITAGSYGVKAWTCEMDHEAYRADKDVDPYSIPRTKDGQVVPWGFGKYQMARQRIQFNVPGVRAMNTGKGDQAVGSTQWCERLVMHEASQTLLAIVQGSVYGFSAADGSATCVFRDLHSSPITSLVYAPASDTLVTSTLDSAATVWRIAGGQAHKFRTYGKSVSYVVPDDAEAPTRLLVCSLDGSVTLVTLDTLTPVYRMRLSGPVAGPPAFCSRDRLVLHLGTEVKLFSIQHIYEVWAECNAAPTALRNLPGTGGLVLAEYADSSVRLLNAMSAEHDKAVVTTTPQLSTHGLITAVVSLTRGRLYTLLANGHIHVWQITLGQPPVFLQAWTQHAKEGPTAMVLLDGGSLLLPSGVEAYTPPPPKANAALVYSNSGVTAVPTPEPVALPGGVTAAAVIQALKLAHNPVTGEPHEHLVLGTAAGDCLVIDAGGDGRDGSSGGAPGQDGPAPCVVRFPAFQQRAVAGLALDLDRGLLLMSARNTLKVWSLSDGLRCIFVLDTSHAITRLDLLDGRAVLGTASGSVHTVDLTHGKAVASSSTSDHMDCVTGLATSHYLQHFVTCGRDSHLKVFDRHKGLRRTLYLASPLTAACFLNDQGDILAAIQRKLVVVRASTLGALGAEDESAQGPLYQDLKGSGSQGLRADLRAPSYRITLSALQHPPHHPRRSSLMLPPPPPQQRPTSGRAAAAPGSANEQQAARGLTADGSSGGHAGSMREGTSPETAPTSPLLALQGTALKGPEQQPQQQAPSSTGTSNVPHLPELPRTGSMAQQQQPGTTAQGSDRPSSRGSQSQAAEPGQAGAPGSGRQQSASGAAFQAPAGGEGGDVEASPPRARAHLLLPELAATLKHSKRGAAAAAAAAAAEAVAAEEAAAAEAQKNRIKQRQRRRSRMGQSQDGVAREGGQQPQQPAQENAASGPQQDGDVTGTQAAEVLNPFLAVGQGSRPARLPSLGKLMQVAAAEAAVQGEGGADGSSTAAPSARSKGQGGDADQGDGASLQEGGASVAAKSEAGGKSKKGHTTIEIRPHAHFEGADQGEIESEYSDASGSEGSGSYSGSEGSQGSSSGSSSSGSDGESEESNVTSDEERAEQQRLARERRELAKLRAQQIAWLADNYQLMNLPFKTMFSFDLSAEATRKQRAAYGLQPEDPTRDPPPPAPASMPDVGSTPVESGGGAIPGAVGNHDSSHQPHHVHYQPEQQQQYAHPLISHQGASRPSTAGRSGAGVDHGEAHHSPNPFRALVRNSSTKASLPAAAQHQSQQDGPGSRSTGELGDGAGVLPAVASVPGLPPVFRRMLPILMSESAFLDGPLPPELLALLPPSLQSVKRRKKKKRKGGKKGKAGSKKKAVKAGVLGQQGESLDDLYERALNAAATRKGRPAGAGGPVEGEASQHSRKSGKKKKKRRKGKKKSSALSVVDPAKHLANTTRDHMVMVELKLFEKHRMLTRTSDLAGPQGKGPGAALHMHTRQLHQEPSNLEKEVPEFSKVLRSLRGGWVPPRSRATGAQEEQAALAGLDMLHGRESILPKKTLTPSQGQQQGAAAAGGSAGGQRKLVFAGQ